MGGTSLDLDRVRAVSDIDKGSWGTTTRNYPADEFDPPLTLAAGGRYTYERDNCDDVFPGVYGNAVTKPLFKIHTKLGEPEVTDLASGTDYARFEILESNTNPDLTVSSVSLVPAAPRDGDEVSAQFTVKNQGDKLSPTPYLAITHNDGTQDTQLLSQLDIGQTTTADFVLGPHSAGTYHLSYSLDPNNYIHEWNEKNNTGSFYYNVRALLPDLSPNSTFSQPTTPDPEDDTWVFVDVANDGEAASSIISHACINFHTYSFQQCQPIPLLPAPAHTSVGFDLGHMPQGSYGYDITLDSMNELPETNEANNSVSGTLVVGADQPLYLTVATNPNPWSSAVLSWNDTGRPTYYLRKAVGPTLEGFDNGVTIEVPSLNYSDIGVLNDGQTYFFEVLNHPPAGFDDNTGFNDSFDRTDSPFLGNNWIKNRDRRGNCLSIAANTVQMTGTSGLDCGNATLVRRHGDVTQKQSSSLSFRLRVPQVDSTFHAGLFASQDGTQASGMRVNQGVLALECTGSLQASTASYPIASDIDHYVWLDYAMHGFSLDLKAYVSETPTKPLTPILDVPSCTYLGNGYYAAFTVDTPNGGLWTVDEVGVATAP